MPRVIQPGGGGGKMRVHYTARRKRGLIAASKRMQAEGMTLHAAASDVVAQVAPNPILSCRRQFRSKIGRQGKC